MKTLEKTRFNTKLTKNQKENLQILKSMEL